MQVKRDKRSKLIPVCALAGLIGFCSCSLFQPHVGPSAAKVEEQTQSLLNNDFTPRSAVSNAIIYAETLWDQYNSAVKSHSLLNSSSGFLMTGLGAGAIATGAGGVNPKVVLGLASGAGATYAAGTFLHSSPRQYVYLTGMDALTCAIAATQPYSLSQYELGRVLHVRDMNPGDWQALCDSATLELQHVTNLISTAEAQYKVGTNCLAVELPEFPDYNFNTV